MRVQVLPGFMSSLMKVMMVLGTDNVAVSVYENGSTDRVRPLFSLLPFSFWFLAQS
jgi:hypothetical protein